MLMATSWQGEHSVQAKTEFGTFQVSCSPLNKKTTNSQFRDTFARMKRAFGELQTLFAALLEYIFVTLFLVYGDTGWEDITRGMLQYSFNAKHGTTGFENTVCRQQTQPWTTLLSPFSEHSYFKGKVWFKMPSTAEAEWRCATNITNAFMGLCAVTV